MEYLILLVPISPIIFTLYILNVMEGYRVIGDNYLTRYFLIPRNFYFNIYLHKYTGSDDDRAMHDHPWKSVSFLLCGELQEHRLIRPPQPIYVITAITRFLPKYRSATYTHRLELMSKTAWTLFITGSVVRPWGFHCPNGWIPWHKFVDESGDGIGAGCGDD